MYRLTTSEKRDTFRYQLDDYIKQTLWKSLEEKAVQLIYDGNKEDGQMTAALLEGNRKAEADEVIRAMTAYYKAFNFKNIEDLLTFWLPNSYCEFVIPGYDKAV